MSDENPDPTKNARLAPTGEPRISEELDMRIAALQAAMVAVRSHGHEFLKALVKWCEDFYAAWEMAKDESNHAVQVLYARCGVSDKSFANRAREIGAQAAALLAHVDQLPPSKEAAVELARAERDRPNTIHQWVLSGRIERDTTVKEIRRLRNELSTTSNVPANAPDGEPNTTQEWTVKIHSQDFDGLALASANVLCSYSHIIVSVRDDKLRDEVQLHAGDDPTGGLAARLTK